VLGPRGGRRLTPVPPVPTEDELLVERLGPFLARALPELSAPSFARRLTGGLSCVTYAIGGESWEAILRRPPRESSSPGAHNFAREYRVLESMWTATTVPVPRPLALCADPSVIGAPFYLMERVDGVVLDSRTPEAVRASLDGRRIGELVVDVLAELSTVPPDAMPSRRPADGYLERQMDLFHTLWESNKTREIPEVDELSSWLVAHRPPTQRLSAVHGDFKLDNVMFGLGEPPRIMAVLDWELATAGDPLTDLGWLLFFLTLDDQDERELGEHAVRAGTAFPARGVLAEAYARRSGLALDDLPWYVALSGFKLAAIMEASYRRYLEGDVEQPRFALLEHAVVSWARRGLRAATGELAI
jgi:aminoglycoside phosphotransferase (APT) family kinase protein